MARQKELAGLERPKLADVEEAAEDLMKLKEKRKTLNENFEQITEKLVLAMERRKLTSYKYTNADGEEFMITLSPDTKVKIKEFSADKDADSFGDN